MWNALYGISLILDLFSSLIKYRPTTTTHAHTHTHTHTHTHAHTHTSIRAETRRPLTLATAEALLRCDVDADAGLHVVQLQILVPASRDTGHRKLAGEKGPNLGYS